MNNSIRLPKVSLPKVSLPVVSLPFVGFSKKHNKVDKKFEALKPHILAWYSPQLEGCTNESLATDKKLTDLSGNGYDLNLKNFTFGGLNGFGSYNKVFNGGTINNRWTVNNNGNNIVLQGRMGNTSNVVMFQLSTTYRNNTLTLRVKNLKQLIERYPDASLKLGKTTGIVKDGVYKYTPNDYISIIGLPQTLAIDLGDVIIEEIPTYENALVFNRNTPTWVYSKENLSNVAGNNYGYWESNTVYKIKKAKSYSPYLYASNSGSAGTSLSINVPSYKVRITGIKNSGTLFFRVWDNVGVNNYVTRLKVVKDGTYIIPSYSTIIDATSDNLIPIFRDCYIELEHFTTNSDLDITIEFLPTYAAPKTYMYGLINTIPQNTVKCMMMDFVPMGETPEMYYSQRDDIGYNFAIYTNIASNTVDDIGYNGRNTNGTYINGELNTTQTVLDLLQKRQVIAVNTNNPVHGAIYLTNNSSPNNYCPQMALYSLILFDRELTPKEMKYVMKKLMKFKISGGG